jgi:putative tricarboxylic transport membrane protein
MRRRQAIRLAGLATAALLPGATAARAGAGTVAVIVPDFPSAPAGVAAQVLQGPLAQALGRTVLLDYRPGAGGIVGLMAGARAAPDGNVLTLLTPAIVAAPWLAARMDADPGDFAPIGRISFTPEVLLVCAARPWRRLSDLLAALRADPGRVGAAFDGAWTSAEIGEVMLLDRAGLAARPVPGPAVAAALRDGRIGFAMRPLPWALAALAAGGLRALAVSASARVAALPAVPTLREQGIDVALGGWLALAAPVAAGAGNLALAQAALRTALAEPRVRHALARAGLPPAWLGAAATGRAIAREYRALGPLFAAAGVNVRQTTVAVR